jgi:glycosyltransferase involved in cell wall biosynthesis
MNRPATPAHRAVVFFGGQDWWYHNRAHSDMQLALQVAHHRRVLLVNSIGTRMPIPGRSTDVRGRISRKLHSVLRFVRQPIESLPEFFVYSPLSIPLYESRLGRRINALLLGAQLGVVLRWLRIRSPDVVVTPPTAWEVTRRMRRRSLVFNRSDKHSAWEEVDQNYVAACERALLQSADLVFYVSHALMAEDAPLSGDRAFFLDHGVDTRLFTPTGDSAPALSGLPRPRLGYFGALRDVAVDLSLVERVADEFPTASVVLVGPSTIPLDDLVARPNVHWLGRQPHEAIPAFGRGFDVALMPWRDNDWIRNCNPVKLKEYLALGLPVVTIDFPEVRRYADIVRVATAPDEFVAQCRRAIDDPGDPSARTEAVRRDSWAERGRQLIEQLDRLPQR